MVEMLNQFYSRAITSSITTPDDYRRFSDRLRLGNLTRTENPLSHSCAMLIAYDVYTKKVLIVNHKKAHSWIFPGGHIEVDELPTTTVLREAKEEIGISVKEGELIGPFGAQVLDINNPPQTCREHFDIFFGAGIKPSDIKVNIAKRYP